MKKFLRKKNSKYSCAKIHTYYYSTYHEDSVWKHMCHMGNPSNGQTQCHWSFICFSCMWALSILQHANSSEWWLCEAINCNLVVSFVIGNILRRHLYIYNFIHDISEESIRPLYLHKRKRRKMPLSPIGYTVQSELLAHLPYNGIHATKNHLLQLYNTSQFRISI